MQDGMRAIPQVEIERRQLEAAHLMRNAWPDQMNRDHMLRAQNAYNMQAREMLDNVGKQLPKPTFWQRFKWWLSDVMP